MEALYSEGILSLDLSLVSGTVMLGEPIALRYDITNHSSEKLRLYLGDEQAGWASLSLVDEAGTLAPERPDPRKPQGGLQPMRGVRPDAGQTYQGCLIVTQWLTIPHVGRYGLHFKAHLAYTPLEVPGEQASDALTRPWRETVRTVFVQEQSFTVIVTEPEEDRLRQIAEGLRHDAMTRPIHEQRLDALRALVAMPEQYALASWETLANERGFRDKEALMRELTHAMTPAAADLLAQIWNPSYGPPLLTSRPSVLLDNMYRDGDEALKRHIEGVLARYGKEVSDYELRFIGA